MLKIILQDPHYLFPFNERARDLRIFNNPLWLAQRDVLTPYAHRELRLPTGAKLPQVNEECIVYRDNLYFDRDYLATFLDIARARGTACRAAFTKDDASFANMHYHYLVHINRMAIITWLICGLPNGPETQAVPIVVPTETIEAGYYHVPTYMALEQGDTGVPSATTKYVSH